MFGLGTPQGGASADPLVDAAAVDDFWRDLPRFDPVRAQAAVSNALADFGIGQDSSVERLRALLVLDRRARKLADALLVNYTGQIPQSQSAERRLWRSARELSQGFARAYGQILRQLEHEVLPRAARDYAPVFLLRLFQHRQVEFLLQPFESGQADPATWSELHEAYQFAHSQRLLTVRQEIRRSHDTSTMETTIEREYIHLLLLELMNDGHFSPYDAFWVNQWIPRGCEALTLKSVRPAAVGNRGGDHFVVDLDSAEGLVRASAPGAVRCLYLDTAPLLEAIDKDIAARSDSIEGDGGPPTIGRGGRLKVLRKLRAVYSPKPPRVIRRGERKPVAVIVQAVVGFNDVVRMLRNEQRRVALVDPSMVPEVEEITITVTGAIVASPPGMELDGPNTVSTTLRAEPPVPHLMWEVRDRSESGCRLQGKAASMSGVTPGTLVAIREHEMAPWVLVIVRRRGKVVGDRIDLGVEFVGKEPRRVISTLADAEAQPSGADASVPARRFAVLYLPESGRQPTLPFKTLIMPTAEFEENRCLVLRSGKTRHTVRLKQPIEEQGDFSWLPFEVVARTVLEPAA
jgi:hypothetical protein